MNGSISVVATERQIGRVTVPVKKLKNKKLGSKVRRLRDFCNNVCSYLETLIFKITLRLSGNNQAELENLVTRILTTDSLKITPLRVMYVHLRDNHLYPKSKF